MAIHEEGEILFCREVLCSWVAFGAWQLSQDIRLTSGLCLSLSVRVFLLSSELRAGSGVPVLSYNVTGYCAELPWDSR